MARRAWLAASVAASVVSVLIAVSGGVIASVGGVRVSARSWRGAALLAAACAAAWAWRARRAHAIGADLVALGTGLEARGRTVSAALACLLVVATLVFSTYSASGADASGYLSQAAMWSRFETRVKDPLAALPNWPLAPAETAPLGWRPAMEPGWQVPTYAPGLPWLIAAPQALAGTAGAVAVLALSAGLAVWATGALAARLGGGFAAIIGSLTVATSPTFLYQAFQPMSDVPVTAAWTLGWWLVAEGLVTRAGLACALAVSIRPNLAPLAALAWAAVVLNGPRGSAFARAARFAAPVAVAGAAIAWLQWRWYGSPFVSGYGAPGELFTVANVAPNARLYASWLREAEPALLLVAIVAAAAAAAARWRPAHGRDVAVLLCFAVGVMAAYLVYAVFETWAYVRFLLPAIAVLAAVGGAAIASGLHRAPGAWRGVAAVAILLVVAATGLRTARSLGVFRVADTAARASEMGARLTPMLPPHAVLIAGEQSGSMRHATSRPVVRWEGLDTESLRKTLERLAAEGLEPWWVLDQFEEPLVRSRFAGVSEAQLDWPPRLEAGPLMRTRAWRLADRHGPVPNARGPDATPTPVR